MSNPVASNHTLRVRGLTIGAGAPKIIAPLVGASQAEIVAQAGRARRAPGVDAVEWRVDFYDHVLHLPSVLETLRAIRKELGEMPLLFTFRSKQEGGALALPKEDYYALNLAAARSGLVDLVDVEILTASDVAYHIEALRRCGVAVVGSKHDFDKTPSDPELREYLERGWQVGADLPKLAVMPRTQEDVDRLLNVTKALYEEHGRPLITMSMGALGVSSRLQGERYGSAMTFGALGQASAPGQIPVAQLRRELERIHAELS